MDLKDHWERVYRTKASGDVGWFQPRDSLSLQIITRAVPDHAAAVLDVGGGASTLVDDLLETGYLSITVLDISAAALDCARDRLGAAAQHVSWIEGDALGVPLAAVSVDLWHDRAVFHFLIQPQAQQTYVSEVRRLLSPRGLALISTFAEDGPERCSGLKTARYSPGQLSSTFGADFNLLESHREEHVTPSGGRQPFTYCLFRRAATPTT